MNRYIVEMTHTPHDCVWALKQLLSAGPEFLGHFDWGCKDGEHIGWTIVEAESKFEAQKLVPRILHPTTRIIQLNQFTREQVEAFHEGMAQR
jgi:hypothetical protein